jgi:hypothetical protein
MQITMATQVWLVLNPAMILSSTSQKYQVGVVDKLVSILDILASQENGFFLNWGLYSLDEGLFMIDPYSYPQDEVTDGRVRSHRDQRGFVHGSRQAIQCRLPIPS